MKDDAFLASSGHLLKVWLILLAFVFIFLLAGAIGLRRVKKDSR